jgi:clan AA aspartic protease
MGLTRVTTKLTSIDSPESSYESIFLVDTEATDCLAPADELEKLGVRKEGKTSYEFADGSVREYFFGLVRIEFMGEITAGRVIFGETGVEPLLGVTALESVGITVDPANQSLKRLPAIPLK